MTLPSYAREPMKRSPIRRKPAGGSQEPRVAVARPSLPNGWPAQYITEKRFQADVEQTAAVLGWISSHSHLPYFDTAGWPDLALLHLKKKRFMVRELKVVSAKGKVGKPTPTQWVWLTGLREAGIDADVWTYPFDQDRLLAELSL